MPVGARCARQTPELVVGTENGTVRWGYGGQRTSDAAAGITIEDVRWLVQYVGRISNEQIRRGLEASGATAAEVEGFSRALRSRIARLQEIGS
jgi:hypothetical protein